MTLLQDCTVLKSLQNQTNHQHLQQSAVTHLPETRSAHLPEHRWTRCPGYLSAHPVHTDTTVY